MLTIEKITTREGFARLAPVWNPLLAASASDNLMLTWEWLTTWWEVFGEERELYLLLARDGDELIGIAPLLKRAVQHYGLLPYQRLEFLASGEDEADEICSDYLDFILRRGREAEALNAIFRYLREREPDWDEWLLTDVSAESPNLPLIEQLCRRGGMKLEITRRQICVYTRLPHDWETFLQTLRPSFRAKVRRERRHLEHHGGELRVIESEQDFAAHFEILIHLHQARWAAHGKPGVFSSEKFMRFHHTVAPKLLRRGWLKLYMLLLSGDPVSAHYDFIYHRKAYFYQAGCVTHDPRLDSPGMVVEGLALEHAIAAGCTEYDMLKSAPDSYKFRWGSATRGIIQARLAPPRAKELLYRTTTRCFDGLRQIKWALQRAEHQP